MNLKLIIAILVIAAVPVHGQSQTPGTAKVTKADAQKTIETISRDKAKTQIYCDIAKLGQQAEQERDTKKSEQLYQTMYELGTKLGPEYVAMMDGLKDGDPNSQQEIYAALAEGTHKLCAT